MTNSVSLKELAAQVVRLLSDSHLTIATAESCTGGWIAKALTDIPGSSDCLGYGFVSYSNAAKESLLGVQSKTLVQHGAVSEAVVCEMVAGAAGVSGANIAVAVSGVAGPGGGSNEKPVGTVWVAWWLDGQVDAELYHFSGDRNAVREQTVATALSGLLERIDRHD